MLRFTRLLPAAGLLCGVISRGSSPPCRPSPPGPRKVALIVAIGDYPAASLYPKIDAANDTTLVRTALLTQGFDSANICVVADRAATREGILAGLQWLTDTAQPGGVAVFHYSGHGHRITDDNGDELDGYDELLVPYGAPGDLRPGNYHGERHIRDDELAPILAALRRKVGPTGNVLVLIDACFSGSATRGPEELPVRGVLQPIEVPVPPQNAGLGTTRGQGEDVGSGLLDERASGTRGGDAALGPMVVISAARHDQVAHETYDDNGQPVGSLSLALSRALARIDSTTTYRALFDRIAVAMAAMQLSGQQPQIEGAVDTKVFSGQGVSQTPFFKVASVAGDTGLTLRGGSLLGLLPQTQVAFLPAGTRDPRGVTPLASGVVRRADAATATVALSSRRAGTSAADLKPSWAFVTEYAYGDLRVRVKLDAALASRLQDAIRASLAEVPILQIVATKPDLLVTRATPAASGSIVVIAAADNAPLTGAIDPTKPDAGVAIQDAARGYARSRYLRQIEMTDPRINVSMELIPTSRRIVDNRCVGTDTLPVEGKRGAGGEWELVPNDVYLLRIRNEGEDAAYVSILDLTPDGRVEQLFPDREDLGSANMLPPHRSYLIHDSVGHLDCYYVEPPDGVEVLKLFATHERVDFTPVLSRRGEGTGGRGSLSPLQQLLSDAYHGTRSDPATTPPSTGTTYGITIVVKKSGP